MKDSKNNNVPALGEMKKKDFLKAKVSRRTFLKSTAHSSITMALLASCGGIFRNLFSQELINWRLEFLNGLEKKPWLYAFNGVSERKLGPPGLVQISGKIPSNLRGTLFRNGPAFHEMDSMRYHHLFDGDGMVQAYKIGNNSIGHMGKIVNTKKFQKEFAVGKRLFTAFGTPAPAEAAESFTNADDINVANISVLKHHNKLFALWEGGSMYELDEKTLDTIGPYTLAEDLEGYPLNPHPRVESDGTLWNVGYSLARSGLVLYHMDKAGKLVKWKFFDHPNISYFHDFLITDKHLILPLSPYRFQGFADDVISSYQWKEKEAMEVWVFDKNTFERKAILELPAQFIFHYGNAYEDSDGIIHYDAISYNNADIMQKGLSELMRGEAEFLNSVIYKNKQRYGDHLKVTIDLKNKSIRQESLLSPKSSGIEEFPTVDPRVIGKRHTFVITVEAGRKKKRFPFFNSVVRRNIHTGLSQSFSYGSNEVAEEHVYVPDYSKSAENGGWIIGSTINVKKKRTYFHIFEANSLSKGPVARAKLPYATPYTFHGTFVPAFS